MFVAFISIHWAFVKTQYTPRSTRPKFSNRTNLNLISSLTYSIYRSVDGDGPKRKQLTRHQKKEIQCRMYLLFVESNLH